MIRVDDRIYNCNEDDIYTARVYSDKIMSHRYELGEDYDEDHAIYNAMPNGVQEALSYLYYIGEID